MRNPPNAGDRKMLPRIATYGLQIVSPSGGCPAPVAGIAPVPLMAPVAGIDAVAGIDDPGPVPAPELIPAPVIGNGGGPAGALGVAGKTAAMEGRGGGVTREASTDFASAAGAALLGDVSLTGSFRDPISKVPDSVVFFSAPAPALPEVELAAGMELRNSEIGFQAAFASSQARSVGLKLPSAIFSRMADSEKRPAYCPFR